MADAGVAATVLTATDLYLGGRHTDHNVPRNVVDLNFLTERGVPARSPPTTSSIRSRRSATASCCAR